jgi:hypothetical protein
MFRHPYTLTTRRWLPRVACILVASCSSDFVHESHEQAEAKLQSTERAVQPTVSGIECGASSVQSAIASCRAQGGHYGHCAIVASRVGVSDATACYNYAAAIRKRRALLVGQEDQLDAQIRYLEDVNAATQELNVELNSSVQEVTARTDTAVDSLRQGEMTKEELAQLHAIVDNHISSAQRQLAVATRELQSAAQYRDRAQRPTTAELDAEISRLQALLDETQRQTSALTAQRERI